MVRRKVKRDPDAPKKPLSAFFIYLKKRRMDIAAKDAQALKNVTELTAKIGKEWNGMT